MVTTKRKAVAKVTLWWEEHLLKTKGIPDANHSVVKTAIAIPVLWITPARPSALTAKQPNANTILITNAMRNASALKAAGLLNAAILCVERLIKISNTKISNISKSVSR